MKQIITIITLIIIFSANSIICTAQQAQFACFSYNRVVASLPEAVQYKDSLAHLKAGLDEEMKRMEDDFNTKYEDFLDGQKEFPTIIRQKRQNELQEMMQRNVDFRQQMLNIYDKTKKSLEYKLQKKVNHAVRKIGEENKYAFILNTDGYICPWVNEEQCIEITKVIINSLTNHEN